MRQVARHGGVLAVHGEDDVAVGVGAWAASTRSTPRTWAYGPGSLGLKDFSHPGGHGRRVVQGGQKDHVAGPVATASCREWP